MTRDEAIREAYRYHSDRFRAGATSCITIERAVDDDADYAVREYASPCFLTPGWVRLLVMPSAERWWMTMWYIKEKLDCAEREQELMAAGDDDDDGELDELFELAFGDA